MLKSAATSRALIAAASAALGLAGLTLWAGAALAAGTGYGPGSSTGTTTPGGFSSVVTSQTVPASGGTVSASYDGETLSVTIPAGDFPTPVQVSLTAPTGTAVTGAVTTFDLTFTVDGKAVTGTLAAPVTFTIKDASIKSGDTVDVWNGSKWVAYSDATVTNGVATITVTSDPAFAVLAASSSSTPATSTVSGATTATSGIPVDTVAALAGALVLVGAGGLFYTRRRRASARST